MEHLLLKFKKKYKNIRFFEEQSTRELKDLTKELLPDIMANRQNLATDIINDFKSFLNEYKTGVVSKEKIKEIIKWYINVFGNQNISLLIMKYYFDDNELKQLIENLEIELNLTYIKAIISGEGI